ncbi:MAG: ABC transporter permease, partial [Pseudomonadota bacterium]|nr:ABC transporter permease [Pseudomonadota bacterium]
METASIKTDLTTEEMTIRLFGPLDRLSPVRDALADVPPPASGLPVRIDANGLTRLDTVGALTLSDLKDRLERGGHEVRIDGLDAAADGLVAAVAHVPEIAPEKPGSPWQTYDRISHMGRMTIIGLMEVRDIIAFFGETISVFLRVLRHPSRFRWAPLFVHMQQVGVNAIPIVGLLSFLVGAVLAWQGVEQLNRFAAGIYVVNLMGIGMLREIGVLITAIIVAGRSGSAFTAQIGTMKINEEIDAMRTIGMDPMELLVIPRIIAMMLVLPLLTFFAGCSGILAGAVVTRITLDLSFIQYFDQLRSAITTYTLWAGQIKTPVFAFTIAMIGCY